MENKKFLGQEFDHQRANRVMRLAGVVTAQDQIDAHLNDLRKKGKLHPILDHYDIEINKKLGKKLFKL